MLSDSPEHDGRHLHPHPPEPVETQDHTGNPIQSSPQDATAKNTDLGKLSKAITNFEWKTAIEMLQNVQSDIFSDFVMDPGNTPWPSMQRTLLHFVVGEMRPDKGEIPADDRYELMKALIEAIRDQSTRKLIVNKGDVNQTTVLHLAPVSDSSQRLVEYLLDEGADINCRTSHKYDGQTPLHTAALQRMGGPVVRLLIDRGADVNARTDGGHTPLHFAAANLRIDIVRILSEHLHGTERMPYDNELATPLDHARARAEAQSLNLPHWMAQFKAISEALRWTNEDQQQKAVAFDTQPLKQREFSKGFPCRVQILRSKETSPNAFMAWFRVVLALPIQKKTAYELFYATETTPWFRELFSHQIRVAGLDMDSMRKDKTEDGEEGEKAQDWLAPWIHLGFHNVRG